MRQLWECNDWSIFLDSNCRKGIRLRFDKEVDSEVKRACKEYVEWLRARYDFPIRVPVYFKTSKHITEEERKKCPTFFLVPGEKFSEPYISVSVDNYQDLLEEGGKDWALTTILHSITHMLSYYFQWIKDYDLDDEKNERQAKYYAKKIVDDYIKTREHP